MTPEQIELIRRSWPRLEPVREAVIACFYARLFEQHPHTRSQFGADIAAQGAKLGSTLNVVVDHLHDLGAIEPALRQLGARHLKWRVTDSQYDDVREALLWALQHTLGDDFTPALRAAWHRAYEAAAAPMKAGAAAAAGAATAPPSA